MSIDRRSMDRNERPRRGAERLPLFNEVIWEEAGDPASHRGIMIGVSTSGLGMLTERKETPTLGTHIRPHMRGRRWSKTAEVIRVDRLSGVLDLVAAEYVSP